MAYKLTGTATDPKDITCDNCPAKKNCVFDQRIPPDADVAFRGGFKAPGHKAENVAYVLVTDSAEGNRTKEDFISCVAWVETLKDRARFARIAREEGKDAEFLQLIGNEGSTIQTRQTIFINGRGEAVKVPRELVPALRAAGISYNPDDNYPPAGTKDIMVDRVVPPYSTPAVSEYDKAVKARIRQRMAKAEATEVATVEARQSDVYQDEPEPEPKKKGNPWGRAGKPKEPVGG